MNLGSGGASTTGSEQPESGASAAQTPGALLAQERTRRGLSIQEAAEGLHLDRWIIEAIEVNRFLALGAPVYAKGYLRKYAELLGLAPDVIVARYDALTDTLPEPTPIPVITTTPPPRPKWPKYVAWALLAAVLTGIGLAVFEFVWPLFQRPTPPDARSSAAASESNAAAAVAPPQTLAAAGAEPAASQARATLVEATESSSAAAKSTPAAPATAASADAMRLTLAFDAPSWVEVYDGAGARLMYDIGQAGRERTVEGTPPLNVVIGVAAAVKVRVNDRDIVVPRRAGRDSTRFVVAADGSVQ